MASFAFRCSYLNSVYYRVWDETGAYEVEIRRGTSDYERSIYNGPAAEYDRNCAGLVGLIRRASDPGRPIPETTVRAFNDWRRANHAASVAVILAHPEKYGPAADLGDILNPPATVRGAIYAAGTGWVVTSNSETVAA